MVRKYFSISLNFQVKLWGLSLHGFFCHGIFNKKRKTLGAQPYLTYTAWIMKPLLRTVSAERLQCCCNQYMQKFNLKTFMWRKALTQWVKNFFRKFTLIFLCLPKKNFFQIETFSGTAEILQKFQIKRFSETFRWKVQ